MIMEVLDVFRMKMDKFKEDGQRDVPKRTQNYTSTSTFRGVARVGVGRVYFSKYECRVTIYISLST